MTSKENFHETNRNKNNETKYKFDLESLTEQPP